MGAVAQTTIRLKVKNFAVKRKRQLNMCSLKTEKLKTEISFSVLL